MKFMIIILGVLSGVFLNLSKAAPSSFSFGEDKVNKWRFIFDHKGEPSCGLPKRYRVSKDEMMDGLSEKEMDDFKSYYDLNMSGSAQFSMQEWLLIQDDLNNRFNIRKENIYNVDLREEPHLFLNQRSIAIAPDTPHVDDKKFQGFIGIAADKMELFESELSKYLFDLKGIDVYKVLNKKDPNHTKRYKKEPIIIEEARTEKDFVQKSGSHYVRFSVTDHMRPTDQLMDDFLKFYDSLPSDAWLHFHCRGGVGRTSSFMLMVDILKNGKKLTLDELIKRNDDFGGSKKLFNLKKLPASKFKDGLVRRDFLVDFYKYINDPEGYGKNIWSKWIAVQKNKQKD
ncbi:MAG: hypothetical protein KBD31_05210 [Proteobacteria bacterium]|nr:hypothetical protein [Pseudomonadota bacterium]